MDAEPVRIVGMRLTATMTIVAGGKDAIAGAFTWLHPVAGGGDAR